MTEALYLQDSYLKECTATVTKITDEKYVVLDKTIFYAISGGQPWDTGTLTKGEEAYNVLFVKQFGADISHEVDKPGLKEGDTVTCKINWERRYNHMRNHSAAHVLAGIICNETDAVITGGQLGEEKSKLDFSLEEFSKEKVEELIKKTNEKIAEDILIKVYTLSKEEALKDPSLFKLATKDYIEKLKEIRVVDIVNFDKQADGGTHVKSLKEIGKVTLVKIDNKGKNNRRIYFGIS